MTMDLFAGAGKADAATLSCGKRNASGATSPRSGTGRGAGSPTVRQAHAAILTGWRRAPQRPGLAAKTPGQGAPQARQLPSAVSVQVPSSYQSRPISAAPQPAQ